ncbi:hypothetical protein M3Y97_00690700 [Aphelenchoides bicaudatus]|nr:hypothetical protein M3Y97_00690700 [Aphelenchoides bicaudatus]
MLTFPKLSSLNIEFLAPQAKETVMTHSPQKECSQSVVNNQKEDRSNNKQKEILKPGHCCKCKQFINYIDQSILKNHCADCCDSAGIIICCICKKVKEQSGIAKQTCKWTANFCRWAVLSKQEESTKRSGSGKCFHFKSSQLHGINRFNFK